MTEFQQQWHSAMHWMALARFDRNTRDEAELALDRYFAAIDRMLIAVHPRIHAPRHG